MKKIIGAICLAIGLVLFVRGHDIAQSLGSQVKHIFTGTSGGKATHYYVGGAILCAAGLVQLFLPSKK
jgi:Protein of unknown function (DUF3185)